MSVAPNEKKAYRYTKRLFPRFRAIVRSVIPTDYFYVLRDEFLDWIHFCSVHLYDCSPICLVEDRMFIYDSSLLVRNVDERLSKLTFSRGLPLGSKVYKIIYVSINV